MAKKAAKKKARRKKSPTRKRTTRRKSVTDRVVDLTQVREQLELLWREPDTEDEVLDLLLSLTEEQRRELSPICQKHHRTVKKQRWVETEPGTFSGNPQTGPASVAAFATGTFTEIKKMGRWNLPSDAHMLKAMEVREVDWGDRLVELVLSSSYYWNSWHFCRNLIRCGLCPKPDNPRYYTAMITGLPGRRWRDEDNSVVDRLRADPSLLKDEIWRLFEYEGDNDNTLANVDRWEDSNWSGALATLSNEGKLPRAKLLKAALSALELGFNHYRARWFFGFFDRMEPTDSELKKHATQILGLMDNPAPNVAQWAFEKLLVFRERGLVKNATRLVESAVPLLGAKHKKTVTQVLKLYCELAATDKKAASAVAVATAEALSHDKADVQKAAFKLIQQFGSQADEELRGAVEQYAAVSSATTRKQIAEWLGGESKQPTKANEKPWSGSSFKLPDMRKLDARFVGLMNLKPLITALGNSVADVSIPAATFDGTDFPRLDPAKRIAPIEDIDELIETLSRVIEDDSMVDDAERCIDGLMRLHTDKPDDFEDRIGPLLKRARTLLKRWPPFSGQPYIGDLCAMICVWARGEQVRTERKRDQWDHEREYIYGVLDEPIGLWPSRSEPLTFMRDRVLDLCDAISSGQTKILLSTPTFEDGWIDADTLVSRTNALKSPPAEIDVILALLRLAPDARDAATKKFKPQIRGESINAIKHGLGGKVARIGKNAALWAAAARCRTPRGDDPRVLKAFPKLGPGAGAIAEFAVEYREAKRGITFDVSAQEKLPVELPSNLPTQLLHVYREDRLRLGFRDCGKNGGLIRWLASTWTSDRETFFAAGVSRIGSNLDWWEAEWENRCYLEPLLDSDTPLLRMGLTMLLYGLAAKEPGEHGLATDIAILAINDGRLGSDNLLALAESAITSRFFNVPRLAKRLRDVANASSLHAYLVMKAFESAVPSLDAKKLPRGVGDIFELLLELGTELGRAVGDTGCREFLGQLKGSNKAAKAAKKLLALEGTYDASECLEIAINNRLERIAAWSQRAKSA